MIVVHWKNIFKSLGIIVLMIFIFLGGYYWGSHSKIYGKTVYSDGRTSALTTVHLYNTEQALLKERKFSNLLLDILYSYYEYHDVEYDKNDSIISKHNFWLDCISETDAYAEATKLIEDAGESWECYGFQ